MIRNRIFVLIQGEGHYFLEKGSLHLPKGFLYVILKKNK